MKKDNGPHLRINSARNFVNNDHKIFLIAYKQPRLEYRKSYIYLCTYFQLTDLKTLPGDTIHSCH